MSNRPMKPAKKPATNSGMFSKSGVGQKKDPVSMPKDVKRAFDHVNTDRRNIKPASY